jgi:hypothetical protein
VIAGTGYIKSANDESLARDEGGGRNLFMEVVTTTISEGSVVWICDTGAGDYHEDSLPGDIIGAEGG